MKNPLIPRELEELRDLPSASVGARSGDEVWSGLKLVVRNEARGAHVNAVRASVEGAR